jgi:putative ABC transport system permease protein
VKALPGVVDVTETSSLPPYGGIGTDIEIPGKTHTEKWQAQYQLVSEGYFRVLTAKLRRGRFLEEVDVTGARKVAVVNQTLVDKWFGHEDPLGRQIQIQRLGRGAADAKVTVEVVGVMADMKNRGIQDPVQPELVVPYTLTGDWERGILVRTAVSPMTLLNPVKREIWAVDRNVATTMTRTAEDFLSDFSYAQPRFVLMVLGVFAGTALGLVAIGVYSVIAYTVSRQTHEIGIRMALGAGRSDVIAMVLKLGLWLIGAGIALGLTASLVVNKVLASELFGVTARDPATFVTVAAIVIAVGSAACWFPALRATKVDPVVALRFE